MVNLVGKIIEIGNDLQN